MRVCVCMCAMCAFVFFLATLNALPLDCIRQIHAHNFQEANWCVYNVYNIDRCIWRIIVSLFRWRKRTTIKDSLLFNGFILRFTIHALLLFFCPKCWIFFFAWFLRLTLELFIIVMCKQKPSLCRLSCISRLELFTLKSLCNEIMCANKHKFQISNYLSFIFSFPYLWWKLKKLFHLD